MAAFLLELLYWSFGQVSFASSGHWVSAALCVKKTVGSPRSSTVDISLLSSPTQAAGIVQHSVAEELSFPSNHVSQLFEGETGILRVLVDDYPASL